MRLGEWSNKNVVITRLWLWITLLFTLAPTSFGQTPPAVKQNPYFVEYFTANVTGLNTERWTPAIPDRFLGTGNFNLTLYYCRSRGDTIRKDTTGALWYYRDSSSTNLDSVSVIVAMKYGAGAIGAQTCLTDSVIIDSANHDPTRKYGYIDYTIKSGNAKSKHLLKVMQDSSRYWNYVTGVDSTAGQETKHWTRVYPQFTHVSFIFKGDSLNRKKYNGTVVRAWLVGQTGSLEAPTTPKDYR